MKCDRNVSRKTFGMTKKERKKRHNRQTKNQSRQRDRHKKVREGIQILLCFPARAIRTHNDGTHVAHVNMRHTGSHAPQAQMRHKITCATYASISITITNCQKRSSQSRTRVRFQKR